MTKIKICGITRLEDAQSCAELGVDYLGFVFVRESARYVEPEKVGEMARVSRAPEALIRPSATFSPAGEKGNKPGNERGLSRDASPVALAHELGLWRGARQVALLPRRGEGARRADEGPLFVGVFRDSPLDEVLRIAEVARLDMIQLHGSEDEEYVHAIDLPVIQVVDPSARTEAPFVMFDSGGGTGRTFDWSLIEQRSSTQPFFLAGGLTPQNVAEAIRVTRPYAVDVSSGVEASPGIKDPRKLRDFVKKVREP